MARQNLLYQRGARADHADDKNRTFARHSEGAGAGEEVGREGRDLGLDLVAETVAMVLG